MSLIKKSERASRTEAVSEEPRTGRLHSAAEMNAIFADWNADRDDAEKLNTLSEAIMDNVVRMVGSVRGQQFAKRPPLHQREDIAMETVIKVLRHLPGNPSHDSALAAPFKPSRSNASFNSYVNRTAYSVAIDYFRRNKDDRTVNIEGVDEVQKAGAFKEVSY